MKTFMIKLMLLNSMTTLIVKNPLSMGTILIYQTMLLVMLMNKMCKTTWFTMLTFLMMVGGLLILFTYMTSIASNEKFKLNINMTMTTMIMLPIMDEMMMESQTEETQSMLNTMTMEKLSMMKLFSKKSMNLTLMMIMYLLLSMITVSKIINHHEGPLRTKF
uniref:NADH dehydrogenase subunit 6 n=1 Tax=Xestocephalus gracilus TaxID=3112137 RepID=UPI002E78891B|nr:NADH dehydrogenase subunit 6 [Xestocephalus gracilus]WRK21307.1 NADH dehydrogenase subunit 6 [Xestocephalus gracilus]